MRKPASIARFERLYAAAMLCGAVSVALIWPHWEVSLAYWPALSNLPWLLPLVPAVWFSVRLALWYFAARRATVAAKWGLVLSAGVAFGLLLLGVTALIVDAAPSIIATIAGIGAGVLHVMAAAYLFRRDARLWFGEVVHGEGGLER